MPQTAPTFEIPESFNLAEYLLDRRITEGRGGRIALRLSDHTLTYREVPGPGQPLRPSAQAARRAARRSGHDRFAGRTGVRRRPVRYPQDRRRGGDGQPPARVGGDLGALRLHPGGLCDCRFPGLRSFQPGRRRAPAVGLDHGRCRDRIRHPLRDLGRASRRRLGNRHHASRRPCHLALLRRHHRSPQSGRPEPSLVRQHHRALRQGRPRLPRGRRHAVGAQALLRLRHRLESLLPVLGRSLSSPLSRAPDPRGAVRGNRSPPTGRS